MSKRKKNNVAPRDQVMAELGLNANEWRIGIGYSKGFLSASRGVDVSVTHVPTGKSTSAFIHSTGKAAARRDAIITVRRLIQQLRDI